MLGEEENAEGEMEWAEEGEEEVELAGLPNVEGAAAGQAGNATLLPDDWVPVPGHPGKWVNRVADAARFGNLR